MSRFLVLLTLRARRDRVQLPVWIGTAAVLAVFAYVGTADAFGTLAERRALLAAALANPVILLFRGLPSGAEEGAFMAFLILPVLAMLAALMSSFLAVRHTRGDEEDGRTELVAATPAGIALPLWATLVHGVLADAAMGVAVAAGFLVTGSDVTGSLLIGAAVGTVGVVFLALALLAAQLAPTPRAANSVSVWVIVGTFVLAGFGNAIGTPSDDLTRMQSAWPTWLSPFGWAENTRAFDADDPWPLVLGVASALVLTALALVLVRRRDVGEGFVAARRRRPDAGAMLRGPLTLSWRLTRGALAGWAVGGLLVGALSTSLSGVIDEIGADNPSIEQILSQIADGGDLSQATVTTFFTMAGILAACAGVQTITRARQEEARGRVEPVWAAPVGRVRWVAAWLSTAVIGIAIVIGAALAGAALGAVSNEDAALDAALAAGGGQFAAALAITGIGTVVLVLAPRWTLPAGWALVLAAALLGLFGPIFGLPDALVQLSPFAAAPSLDGDELAVRGLWWLLAVTAAATVGALALSRRRELVTDG